MALLSVHESTSALCIRRRVEEEGLMIMLQNILPWLPPIRRRNHGSKHRQSLSLVCRLFLLPRVHSSWMSYSLALTWVFWTAAAGSITSMLHGGLDCSHSAVEWCGVLNALEAFAWIIWALVTYALIAVVVRGCMAVRVGDGWAR